MFDKLDFILEKYEELSLKVSDPDIINNQPLWQKHIKEMGEMEPIVNKYKEIAYPIYPSHHNSIYYETLRKYFPSLTQDSNPLLAFYSLN